MSHINQVAAVLLFSLSLVLYVIGITTPFMTFTVSFNLSEMIDIPFLGSMFGNSIEQKTTKSLTYTILEAVRELVKNKQYFVAFLISFFAVFVPVVKTLLSFLLFAFRKRKFATAFSKVVSFMGKFAMADVFVVGVFIAFLYTQTNQFLKADINNGYYFFAGYVLLSIISTALFRTGTHVPDTKSAS
ncbi:MAG: paraquat-inducible protein A [Candidatus Competibacteraceae bacterium]|nr:paraquat-inducible protein A [Candidatus Competibacteraceae bacterium]